MHLAFRQVGVSREDLLHSVTVLHLLHGAEGEAADQALFMDTNQRHEGECRATMTGIEAVA